MPNRCIPYRLPHVDMLQNFNERITVLMLENFNTRIRHSHVNEMLCQLAPLYGYGPYGHSDGSTQTASHPTFASMRTILTHCDAASPWHAPKRVAAQQPHPELSQYP